MYGMAENSLSIFKINMEKILLFWPEEAVVDEALRKETVVDEALPKETVENEALPAESGEEDPDDPHI